MKRLGLALLFATSFSPCAPGELTVGAANPAEYVREGEAYAVQCYLVDATAGTCEELLQKQLPVQYEQAATLVPILDKQARRLVEKDDLTRGATWCKFLSPGGCTYREISGNVVLIVARADGINPSSWQPIADGCKDAGVGTAKHADVRVRLAGRTDTPAGVVLPKE